MESLAYTIIELRVGRLPWEDCTSHGDIFVLKQRWTGEHWAATTDCPKVYGHFLDSIRDRGQVLDYARWKRELCGDSEPTRPSAEAPFKYQYHPSDDDAPIRWKEYHNDLEPPKSLTASDREQARVLKSPEPWPWLSGSERGFHPRSTWSGPVSLEDEASFGDEQELVLRELALIDRPPTFGTSLGVDDPAEVMKSVGDVLGNTTARAVGELTGGKCEDKGSGNDRGYSGSEGEGSEDPIQDPNITDSDFRRFYDLKYDRD